MMEDITKPAPKLDIFAKKTDIFGSVAEEKTKIIASSHATSMPKNTGEKSSWDEGDDIKEKNFFAILADLFAKFGEAIYEITANFSEFKKLKEEEEAYLSGKMEPTLEEQIKRSVEKVLNNEVEQTFAQDFEITKQDAPLMKKNKLKQEVLAKIFTDRTQKELKAILAHINKLLAQNKDGPEFANEARKLFEALKRGGLTEEVQKLAELQKRMERFQNKVNAVEGSEKNTSQKAQIIEALAREEQARMEAKKARFKTSDQQHAHKTENLKGVGVVEAAAAVAKEGKGQAASKHVESLQKRGMEEQQIRQR